LGSKQKLPAEAEYPVPSLGISHKDVAFNKCDDFTQCRVL